MNFDLLNENLLILFTAIITAVFVFLSIQLFALTKAKNPKAKKTKAAKSKDKQLFLFCLFCLIGSIIIALITRQLIAYYFDSSIPFSLFYMILPATISIAFLVLIIKFKPNLWIISSCCILIGVAFSLVLINDYYRFYPTVGELFNKNSNVEEIERNQDGLMFNFTHTISSNNSQTLESELNTVNNKTTTGQTYSLAIPGTASRFKARSAYVYIPAAYNSLTDVNFPVVVLTTGFPGLPENWIGSGLVGTMNQFAQLHEGITPLVFMVDNTGAISNDTECVNSPRGNVETYLTTDVPNYIKANFRVLDNPSHWALGGLSMGGMCSVMLTLRHTNVYHYFMDFGGEIGPEVGSQQKTITELFGGSGLAWQEHQPSIILASHNYKGQGIGGFFGAGNQDSRTVTQAVSQLASQSQKAGIETVSETIVGPHSFNVWQELFKDSLPWISNRIGATQCLANCD